MSKIIKIAFQFILIFGLILVFPVHLGLTHGTSSAVFYDSFDDGVADGWTEHEGPWSVTNGEYCVSVSHNKAISTVNGFYLKDFTIETNFRFTGGTGYRAGLVFRYMGQDTYYSLEVSNEYDVLCFVKYLPECARYGTQDHGFVGTAPTEISFARGELMLGRQVIGSVPTATIENGVKYTLRVSVTGNRFVGELISNEFQQTIEWKDNDNPLEYGAVGLRARSTDVSFDSFRIDNVTLSDFEPPEPIDPELLAWWKLNEGNGTVALDSSGLNYHGKIEGANWLNYQGESALNFDGESDYIAIPSHYVTDLDSLSVVAWINSDLTKTGYAIYQGNLGQFFLGNCDPYQNNEDEALNPAYAKFAIKLADHNWFDVISSFPMKPNTWHQIVGVWEKGVSTKIYIDGVLAGENNQISSSRIYNPGSSYPTSIGVYGQGEHSRPNFFKGQISNVMLFNTALTNQELIALYDNVTIPVVARPILDVSCQSFSSNSGLNVEIQGSLALEDSVLPNSPILLSYSVNKGKSWQDLTTVMTASDGTYSAIWYPSVTGIYMIRAVYEGEVEYLGTTTGVNFSVTQDAENNVFSVNSNSTVSSLVFNSTTQTLAFSVKGESGTRGYADVYMAKTLLQTTQGLEVYLDDNKLDYTFSSTNDSWILHLKYSHSTHCITVNLATNAQLIGDLGNWTFYGAITVVILIIGIAGLILKKRRSYGIFLFSK